MRQGYRPTSKHRPEMVDLISNFGSAVAGSKLETKISYILSILVISWLEIFFKRSLKLYLFLKIFFCLLIFVYLLQEVHL